MVKSSIEPEAEEVALSGMVALQEHGTASLRLTTMESLLFQLLRNKDHACFKAISGLAKGYKEAYKEHPDWL